MPFWGDEGDPLVVFSSAPITLTAEHTITADFYQFKQGSTYHSSGLIATVFTLCVMKGTHKTACHEEILCISYEVAP